MIERNLVAVGTPSDKYALFVRLFRELIEEYNQAPKKDLGGLCPLEFYELHRPPAPVNERSQAEIIEATRISEKRKLTNGKFSYGGELYNLPKGILIGTNEVIIWVDPVDPLPPRIPVEFKDMYLGDATYAPKLAARQLDRPQGSVRDAAKVADQVVKAVGDPKMPEQAPKNSQEAKSSSKSTVRKTRTRKGKAITASKPESGRKDNEQKFEIPAVLVHGHGPFAWGPSGVKAVENAFALEIVAEMALKALQLNPEAQPIQRALLDKHFLRKHGAGAYYGQPKAS
jgi:hypothetical protein